jgi:hypothetical protein
MTSLSEDRRRGTLFIALAILLGILLSGAMVLTASRAAFSDTTDNSDNSFTTGDVELVDDDTGAAMFTVTDMVPGQSATRCILVTYQGTVPDPGQVVLYSGGFVDSASLGDHLDLTVEEGTGGDFSTCTGFNPAGNIETSTLTDFDTDHTNYANGVGTWDPSGTPESVTYRITVTLDAAAPSSAQGQSVTDLLFIWEIQS